MTELDYMSRIEKSQDCWIWKGSSDAKGYGRAWFKGRQYKAHRAIYEIIVGQIPPRLELDHTCRNRICVNPKHLEPVTHAVNVRRGISGWQNRIKKYCKRGHEFDASNTYVRKDNGFRACKKCYRLAHKEWLSRQEDSVAQYWVKEFES